MVRRLSLVLCACVMLFAATPAIAAARQEPDLPLRTRQAALQLEHRLQQSLEPSTGAPTLSYVDAQLLNALEGQGLVQDWFDAGSLSADVSLMRVQEDVTYHKTRQSFLDDLQALAAREDQIEVERARVQELAAQFEGLQELLLRLHGDIKTLHSRGAVRIPDHRVYGYLRSVQGLLLETATNDGPMQHAAVVARQVQRELASEVGAFRYDRLPLGASTGDTLERLERLTDSLRQTRPLLGLASQHDAALQVEVLHLRQRLVETMPALHQLRLLAPSVLDGISLTTIDAYVRGAQTVPATCPVDWALLAGIGRIESLHGTIDDTQVQASGRVTKPILGPLLDGGATEREAAEAAALAAEEAELAFAEAERVRLADEEELKAYLAAIYGPVEEPIVEEEEPEEPPELDLWGRPVVDEANEGVDDDDEGDSEDDEEPELLGNGFAVIEDSDNGRLDGNDRWDRAVGPMQFIPETWSYFATDGNDDGIADPQNLYDAAATAAKFLCRLSQSRGSAPQSFVLGYNQSQAYVADVVKNAERYRAKSILWQDLTAS